MLSRNSWVGGGGEVGVRHSSAPPLAACRDARKHLVGPRLGRAAVGASQARQPWHRRSRCAVGPVASSRPRVARPWAAPSASCPSGGASARPGAGPSALRSPPRRRAVIASSAVSPARCTNAPSSLRVAAIPTTIGNSSCRSYSASARFGPRLACFFSVRSAFVVMAAPSLRLELVLGRPIFRSAKEPPLLTQIQQMSGRRRRVSAPRSTPPGDARPGQRPSGARRNSRHWR